jgi:hypothetical protein
MDIDTHIRDSDGIELAFERIKPRFAFELYKWLSGNVREGDSVRFGGGKIVVIKSDL